MSNAELTIIRQAIVKELEGYEFYKMVSERPGNSLETKESFKQLANEELKHVDFLKEMFVRVKSGKIEDLAEEIELDVPAPGNEKWKKFKKDSGSIAVAVFGIAINMEKASIEYYTNAAAKTQVKGAKELFEKLAKWEKNHLEFLTQEYEDMLGDWWSEQGFAPF
ncbi:MAG: Rubrerythrin [Firmicutes bacterium]|nr:Rubrerythrin [Bacillota bacterium]